jgi:uncharacterized protein (DUF1684 family)
MLALLVPMILSAPPSPSTASADLQAETDAWHHGRLERLRAEDGWLTLVNLAWLEEGEHKVGSHPDAAVQLPPGAPALLGTFSRRGAELSFTPAPGVEVTRDGTAFKGGPVRADADGKPEVLRHGTLQLLVLRRGDRVGVRVRDSAAPTRTGFKGIARFPVSAAWRKQATWEPAEAGKTVRIPNVLGDVSEQPLAGTAVFAHQGRTLRLDATREGDQLFFVFGDGTNKDATYGAGRFLYTPLPQESRVTLDFNRAYNPPCAFTPYATCPLPPRQNRLEVRVEAGELRYAKP